MPGAVRPHMRHAGVVLEPGRDHLQHRGERRPGPVRCRPPSSRGRCAPHPPRRKPRGRESRCHPLHRDAARRRVSCQSELPASTITSPASTSGRSAAICWSSTAPLGHQQDDAPRPGDGGDQVRQLRGRHDVEGQDPRPRPMKASVRAVGAVPDRDLVARLGEVEREVRSHGAKADQPDFRRVARVRHCRCPQCRVSVNPRPGPPPPPPRIAPVRQRALTPAEDLVQEKTAKRRTATR